VVCVLTLRPSNISEYPASELATPAAWSSRRRDTGPFIIGYRWGCSAELIILRASRGDRPLLYACSTNVLTSLVDSYSSI
jgi:hypothetical protein